MPLSKSSYWFNDSIKNNNKLDHQEETVVTKIEISHLCSRFIVLSSILQSTKSTIQYQNGWPCWIRARSVSHNSYGLLIFSYKCPTWSGALVQDIPLRFSSPQIRESNTVLDSGIHTVDSKFLVLEFHIRIVSGTWIADSNGYWDSGFLELFSGFQSPGFRFPQAKLSWIPDYTSKDLPDPGIRSPLHEASFSHTQMHLYPVPILFSWITDI